jgi:hypothetical protein
MGQYDGTKAGNVSRGMISRSKDRVSVEEVGRDKYGRVFVNMSNKDGSINERMRKKDIEIRGDNMEIRIEGFDEIHRNLKKISDKAKEIEGNNQIPFTKLFTDSFIEKYTNFKNTQDFVDTCENSLCIDFLSIDENDEIFNHLIKEKTSFGNWNEMIGKATAEWVGKKLGF